MDEKSCAPHINPENSGTTDPDQSDIKFDSPAGTTITSRNPLYRYRLNYSLWCPDSPIIGLTQFACDYVIFV